MKCSDQILIELLNDTEVATEDEATLHLESCAHCQQRLEQLAADEDSWNNVAVALEDDTGTSVVIAIDTELAEDMPLQADPVSLDFLDSPRHPEMLGRIGRYDVERLIGMGGMGIVLKAFDTELHRAVAVKVLAPHLAHSGAARQRFAREAQSAAAVVHENVVPIHNVDAAGKLPFLVMQYVSGESLQARVDRDGPLTVDEVLRIGAQMAHGLSAAHEQGLVHRDVKPGNVLLEESIDRVLISDFGLARAADDASVTRSGVIAGTPHYMSPEQARGNAVDARSDLFGLGSVLYFMCTGRPPFRADGAIATLNRICHDPHRPVDLVNERVPTGLAELIDELLAKQPTKRPNTSLDVANRLTTELQDKRSRNRFRRSKIGRWRWGATAIACGTMLLAALWLADPFQWRTRTLEPPFEAVVTSGRPNQDRNLSHRPSQAHDPFGPTYVDRDPNSPPFIEYRDSTRPNGPAVSAPMDTGWDTEPSAPSRPYPAPNFNQPVIREPKAVPRSPFHDQEFYDEVAGIRRLVVAIEQASNIESPHTTSQDDGWQAELEVASEITTALESGVPTVVSPRALQLRVAVPDPFTPRVGSTFQQAIEIENQLPFAQSVKLKIIDWDPGIEPIVPGVQPAPTATRGVNKTVSVGGGGRAPEVLEFKALNEGTHKFRVIATDEGGKQVAKEASVRVLPVERRRRPKMNVSVNGFEAINAGGTDQMTVSVNNDGLTPITNGQLIIAAVGDVSIANANTLGRAQNDGSIVFDFETLQPDEGSTVEVEISASRAPASGEGIVRAQAKSDQGTAAQEFKVQIRTFRNQ